MNGPESNRRILLVDDNPAIHEDFKKILVEPRDPSRDSLADAKAMLFGQPAPTTTRLAFEIDSALQGAEALDMVQQAHAEGRPYAMAFVDIRMPPGWDGIETIRCIWAAHPDLQAVICTAYSDYSWEQMIGALGHSDNVVILKKPFDNIEVLRETLSNMLAIYLSSVSNRLNNVMKFLTLVATIFMPLTFIAGM